jgi:cytochrome c oxidase cbb3-type subunit 4
MADTYKWLAEFAQTWGLLYFVLIFAGVLIYALHPKRRRKFEDAARIPLEKD